MKLNFLFIFIFISQLSIAQFYNFGKLKFSLNSSEKIQDYEGMRRIIFDKTEDNTVVLNKISNKSLPNIINLIII